MITKSGEGIVATRLGEDPESILSSVELVLEEYKAALGKAHSSELHQDSWLESAAELGVLAAAMRDRLSHVNKGIGIASAQAAILMYLRNHVGESVPGAALAGVAGINEWARRVRELRVEHGWPIESGVTREDMDYDHYKLAIDEADDDLVERWRIAKEARNLKKASGKAESGKARLLHYLKAIAPRMADKEQLAYVSQIKEFPRRIRELEEEGWQIDSNVDDPSLPPGSYRMPTLEKRPPRVREAIKLRYKILERDGKKCQDCGSSPAEGAVLQVHHILPVHQGGNNADDNLVTLCSQCHAGRHSLMGGSPKDELLNPDQKLDLR
ncbi:HNH endonuclease [Streptomyces sp. NPDC059761]|uniref:HNH endonuclease n=1 Tax=Streptomyces sp. NPDC059761 TaxID=3346937 RepID=UPI0036682DE1